MDEIVPINYNRTILVLRHIYGCQGKYKEFLDYIQKKYKIWMSIDDIESLENPYFLAMLGEKAKAEGL